ncbi:MAG: type II toxin-antitoxin system RelE/ParE family toxin [Deltaproteobacteria bacterium]|nr:type II toxin-antitoxin system RelE/ParE family toxin [Deltaproteobacteria bacterium]
MIISFGNKLAKDLVEEIRSKEVRAFPKELIRAARKKLFMLHGARAIHDLRMPPGNRLEKLKGKGGNRYSIRINDQWRIVFRFGNGNAEHVCVEDYHR